MGPPAKALKPLNRKSRGLTAADKKILHPEAGDFVLKMQKKL